MPSRRLQANGNDMRSWFVCNSDAMASYRSILPDLSWSCCPAARVFFPPIPRRLEGTAPQAATGRPRLLLDINIVAGRSAVGKRPALEGHPAVDVSPPTKQTATVRPYRLTSFPAQRTVFSPILSASASAACWPQRYG